MHKTPTSSITKIFISVLLILIIGAITFYIRQNKSDQMSSQSSNHLYTEQVSELLAQLRSRWQQGDLENHYELNKFNCPELIFNSKLVDSEFLKCNPNYLECFLRGKTGSVHDFNQQLKFIKNGERFVTVTPQDSVLLQAKLPALSDQAFTIELANTCRDTYLPQRIYSAGPKQEDRYVWDNFSRHIFIDRFYVSNQDVFYWAKTHKKNVSVVEDPRYWFFPSTNLTLEERHDFCQSYGKQLLQSHILDAASFIPSDVNNPRPKFIYKHPFWWTKKHKSEFLSIAKRNKDYELSKNDCTHAYVKGCDKVFPYKFYATDTASWTGIYFSLGHYMEVVDNKFDTFQNLKASSFYFSSESMWHEIGLRAHWDGEGLQKEHFSFKQSKEDKDIYPPKNVSQIEVAFRCMRYRESL